MESATCKRGFSIRTLTKTAQRYSLGAVVMMIDMNGPDNEAVDESEGANSGILEGMEELQEEECEMEHCRCNPREQERTGHE